MNLKMNIEKGLLKQVTKIELVYEDETTITLDRIMNFDMELVLDGVSCIKFTTPVLNKYLMNRFGKRTLKSKIKQIKVDGKVFKDKSVSNSDFTFTYLCDMKVRKVKVSQGINTIAIEGNIK